jgi:hypothetical protein
LIDVTGEHSSLTIPLESVRYQFEEWRQTRKSPRELIPGNLWAAAIRLCSHYSINHVSRSLHLSYTTLKKKVQGKNPVPKKKKLSSPTFVELDWQDNFPATECIIEMDNAHGSKMRMSLKGRADLDLLELGKVFWNRGK